jgi:hypothetical protein
MIVCAPLTFLPLIFGKRNAPESVVHQINTIQAILDRSGLPRVAQQLVWRALINKYVDAAKPDLSAPPNLEAVFNETANELPFPKDLRPG